MLSLPLVYLCNAIVFLLLMEERFKVITSLAVSAVVFVLSLISGAVANGFVSDPAAAGEIAAALSVLWCLLASVFIASNSIVQKLFLALVLFLNYVYLTDLLPELLGGLPFGTAGILAILLGNGIFLLFSFVVAALMVRPLHYFYRRGVSPSGVFLCVMVLVGICIAKGSANTFFGTDSFALRFFLVLWVYLFFLFTLRAVYAGARYKARDITAAAESRVQDLRINNLETMLVNVESFRNAKSNVQYAFQRLAALAKEGKTGEISSYVNLAISNDRDAPLLGQYCEDPYVNALVATRAAQAAENGIQLECNIALGELKIKVAELCVIIDDLLLAALEDCSKSRAKEKHIRLNVLSSGERLTVEAVNTAAPKVKVPAKNRTALDFLLSFFEEKKGEEESLEGVRKILENHSGALNISHTAQDKITRVGVNP